MNSVEILDKKDQLKKEVRSMTELARKEIRMLTDEEKARVEEIKDEIEKLNNELAELEKENEPAEDPTNDENKEPEQKNNSNRTMEKREFKLVEMLRNVANNKPQDEFNQSILNEGIAEMKRSGLSYQGQIQLPMEARAVTVATEGVDTVATDLFNVLEPLHSKSVLSQAGVKWLTGLQGDVQYPIMSAINATWEGETATTGDSTPTFTNVKLQPKRLSVVVPISKQFLLQEGCGAEQAIRNEIVTAIGAKLESTILGDGAGSSTEPKGIFNGVVAEVSDFAGICDVEAGIEEANFAGEPKYIMSPKAKAAMRGMIKGTNGTGMVFENNAVDGTPALTTSYVADKNFAYGDFSNLIIGQWGTLDIVVDNVTLAADGQIRLIINAYFDAKLAREGAVKVAKIGAGA